MRIRTLKPRGRAAVAFGILAATGLAAAAAIAFSRGGETSSARDFGTGCTVSDAGSSPRASGGGHPPRSFYGPGETPPAVDLHHVLGDGLVVVRYRPDLPAPQLALLKSLTRPTARRQSYLVVAPDPDQRPPVKALTAERQLTCTAAHSRTLERFRDEWIANLRG